jgi:hypothetical protein
MGNKEDWERLQEEIPAIEKTGLEAWVNGAEEDMVNNPSHYTYGKVECIEGIQESMTPEAFKGYCKGACLKYLWRYERKAKPLEDLKKAQWYLNKLIEGVESED